MSKMPQHSTRDVRAAVSLRHRFASFSGDGSLRVGSCQQQEPCDESSQ